jgi:hypothetical protein
MVKSVAEFTAKPPDVESIFVLQSGAFSKYAAAAAAAAAAPPKYSECLTILQTKCGRTAEDGQSGGHHCHADEGRGDPVRYACLIE